MGWKRREKGGVREGGRGEWGRGFVMLGTALYVYISEGQKEKVRYVCVLCVCVCVFEREIE